MSENPYDKKVAEIQAREKESAPRFPTRHVDRGDVVRCEFEARVLEVDDADGTLYLELPSEHLYFYWSDLTRVEIVEPQIQAGDLCYFQGDIYQIDRNARQAESLGKYHARAVKDIPANAVWFVRGGNLNPLLAGEQ